MGDHDGAPVTVSRRIAAPATVIFDVLADPERHPELDGSGMLRATGTPGILSAVGDVFVMQMYFAALGRYEMNNHVVEFERDRRIGWEPAPGRGHPDARPAGSGDTRWGHRWAFELVPDGPGATIVTEIYDCSRAPDAARASVDDGRIWIESMTATLARLDAICVDHGEARGRGRP